MRPCLAGFAQLGVLLAAASRGRQHVGPLVSWRVLVTVGHSEITILQVTFVRTTTRHLCGDPGRSVPPARGCLQCRLRPTVGRRASWRVLGWACGRSLLRRVLSQGTSQTHDRHRGILVTAYSTSPQRVRMGLFAMLSSLAVCGWGGQRFSIGRDHARQTCVTVLAHLSIFSSPSACPVKKAL